MTMDSIGKKSKNENLLYCTDATMDSIGKKKSVPAGIWTRDHVHPKDVSYP